ncbi:hypothetical protein L4Z97_002885 [Pseudomonas aeruginosa]
MLIQAILFELLMHSASASELTVISFGGVAKEVQTTAFYKPFEVTSGNKLIAGEYNGELGRIKVMVDTTSVNWDVVQVGGAELITGEEGLFKKLSHSRNAPQSSFHCILVTPRTTEIAL